MRVVEDLPLVPTTWTERKRRCGEPSTVIMRRIRSRPKRMPNSSSERRWRSARSPLQRASAHSACQLVARSGAAQLRALGLHHVGRRAIARSRRWRACPRRARSRLRAAPARPRAAARRRRDRGPRRRAPRSCRRAPRSRPPARSGVAVAVTELQPRELGEDRRGLLVARRRRSAPARSRPGARSTLSRQPRTSVIASIDALQRDLGVAVDQHASAPRVAAAREQLPPPRYDQSSSVTNGITGCASATVSRSTCSSVAASACAILRCGRPHRIEPGLTQLDVPVAQLAVDEVVEAERGMGEVVGLDARGMSASIALQAREDPAVLDRASAAAARSTRRAPRRLLGDPQQPKRAALKSLLASAWPWLDLLGGVAHVLRGGHREQPEADRVGAVALDLLERVDAGAQRLRHAPAVGRLDHRVDVDVGERRPRPVNSRPIMIIRATHRKRMSRAVESTSVG